MTNQKIDLAKKSLPATLYGAYLMASTVAALFQNVSVFRIDLSNGDQRFFATVTNPRFVGTDDAVARLPKMRKSVVVRTVTHVATVGAFIPGTTRGMFR